MCFAQVLKLELEDQDRSYFHGELSNILWVLTNTSWGDISDVEKLRYGSLRSRNSSQCLVVSARMLSASHIVGIEDGCFRFVSQLIVLSRRIRVEFLT